MYVVEKHIIKQNHISFNECDALCLKAKNVYNKALYNIRQYFFKTSKYLSYYDNYKVAKEQECYTYLPTKVFCQILRKADMNFKSFFALLKNPSVENQIPRYLDKEHGRFLCTFPKQALGLGEFKKSGKIHLSLTNIYITTKVNDFSDLKEVRIVPMGTYYTIEVVYNKPIKQSVKNGIVAAIDLGLNNLATVTLNNGENPFIINGKPIKSINQYYNKQLAHYQSKLKSGKHTSNRIKALTFKRNMKVNDYLHKASRMIVNQLVSYGVCRLVIGKNIGMKQGINIGKVNNQNFVFAPLMRFANMVEYKCKLEGIEVFFNEESYTSKCSFLDGEEIKKHDTYMGKRIKRGLFKSHEGKLINADVNGSYNIMLKAVPNALCHGIEAVGVQPSVLTVKG